MFSFSIGKFSNMLNNTGQWRGRSSVADPDPPDPHVFGPPGSGSGSTSQRYGSGSFYYHGKNSKKSLDSYFFVTLFDFLSLKNDVSLTSKSNKQKKLY
jgi:hypothetical protein